LAEPGLAGAAVPAWVKALKPLLNGMYTADNLDYVPRDAYMCGVKVGPIDLERLLHYSFLDRQGLLLHQHGAQAPLLFLNARLYLSNNIYYHRTVRRIDLHMREIFRETIERILTGNPLDQLDRYRELTDWSLIDTVDRWRHEGGRAVERSAVADLFRRLPIRTTLVRVFTDETTQAEALRRAVERALYRRDSSLAEAVP